MVEWNICYLPYKRVRSPLVPIKKNMNVSLEEMKTTINANQRIWRPFINIRSEFRETINKSMGDTDAVI
jgi:hypothetical protein